MTMRPPVRGDPEASPEAVARKAFALHARCPHDHRRGRHRRRPQLHTQRAGPEQSGDPSPLLHHRRRRGSAAQTAAGCPAAAPRATTPVGYPRDAEPDAVYAGFNANRWTRARTSGTSWGLQNFLHFCQPPAPILLPHSVHEGHQQLRGAPRVRVAPEYHLGTAVRRLKG
jgi:hypothetical protein